MSEPNPNPTPTPDPQAAPAPQPSPSSASPNPAPVFTQAQVDAMVAKAKQDAHDAANAAARRRYEEQERARTSTPPAQPQPNPPAQPATTSPGLTAQDFLRVSTFTSAAAEYSIPPRGVEMLLERVMTEKPADVSAWIATEATTWGWGKKQPTVTPNPAPTANAAPGAHANAPVTANGSPAGASTITVDTPILALSQADQRALSQRLGPAEFTKRLFAELSGKQVRVR